MSDLRTVLAETGLLDVQIHIQSSNAAARTYFSLLAASPEPDSIRELNQIDFAPDTVEAICNTIYTLYATKYSDSKFNTANRMLEMSA